MPLGGFDTLSFFGIKNSTATSKGSNYVDGFGFRTWNTTYCRSDGRIIGASTSEGFNGWAGIGFSQWNTIYYKPNNCIAGTSTSVAQHYVHNIGWQKWQSKYYAQDGCAVGSSLSTGEQGQQYHSNICGWGTWNTTYYGENNSVVGSSKSTDYSNQWDTTYEISHPLIRTDAMQAQAALAAKRAIESQNMLERSAREGRLKAERLRLAKEKIDVSDLKTYYLSKSWFFFNSSAEIFKEEEWDNVVHTLEQRASQNPDGASEKTLTHFGLK